MKKRTAKLNAQQGDCLLRKLESMPDGAQELVGKARCVLAEGEATGHAHVVEDDEAELIRIGERMLLKLSKAATVQHEEHKPITLEPGIWEIGRVREFDYLSKMVRPIKD